MSLMRATAGTTAYLLIPGLDFVAIDFETANAQRASVCQVGLVKVRDGIPGKQHCRLVFPPRPYENFHEHNIAVHGITRSRVNGAPGWDVILPKLVSFTGGLPLVGHNVSFEKSVVEKATIAIGEQVPYFEYLCSLKLARKHLPDLPSHRLNQTPHELRVLAEERLETARQDTAEAAIARLQSLMQLGPGHREDSYRAVSRTDRSDTPRRSATCSGVRNLN